MLYKEDYILGSILLIGLLLPVVYLMQLTKKRQAINLKRTGIAIVVSVIGVVITTILFVVFNHTSTSIWIYLLSAIAVAIIWALLLSGCYYVYQVLSNSVGK